MGVVVNAGSLPLFQRIRTGGLKSNEEKLERQRERDAQLETLENQKVNLKNMACGSLEEIADKLEMLHSYEDQMKAVKQAYNNEQIWHILDEAREKGEKIAEEAEKLAPKTEEERKEQLIEEVTGTGEEEEGALSEVLDELSDVAEELGEELEKELEEELTEEEIKEASEQSEAAEQLTEEVAEQPVEEALEQSIEEAPEEPVKEVTKQLAEEMPEQPERRMQTELYEAAKHYRQSAENGKQLSEKDRKREFDRYY